MIQFLTILLNARRDEEKGATAVEYGLMVALIAVAIIVIVSHPRRQPRRPVHQHVDAEITRRLIQLHPRRGRHRFGGRPLRRLQPSPRKGPSHAARTSTPARDERGATAVEYGLMIGLHRDGHRRCR